MKSVAFIIISLGKSEYLEQLLKELSSEYRVILVDNSQGLLCQKYSRKYPIEYITEEIQGISIARNKGASMVKTEDYLFFLDDDLSLLNNWKSTIDHILNDDIEYYCLGGKVIAEYDKKLKIPQKYLYLVGEKDFGNSIIELKHDYLGGCNLLIDRVTFNQVNGFNTSYGHKGNELGANEDVILQDDIRRMGRSITYRGDLVFKHHWNGDEKKIIRRLKIQGLNDRLTDLKTKKLIFFLRLIKYTIFVIAKKSRIKKTTYWSEEYFDYIKYKAYLRGDRLLKEEN